MYSIESFKLNQLSIYKLQKNMPIIFFRKNALKHIYKHINQILNKSPIDLFLIISKYFL